MTGPQNIVTKRIYETPTEADGLRVLVDRIWPRGVAKEAAAVRLWTKDLAPSHALRKWFGHRPERWEAFRTRYEAELQDPESEAHLAALMAQAVGFDRVTLLYSARDTERNQAVVLCGVLRRRR